jgi:hypothetical protein
LPQIPPLPQKGVSNESACLKKRIIFLRRVEYNRGMSHDPGPDAPSEPREPTIDELLAIMHADELPFWESDSVSPQQKADWLEGIKARWRALQAPVTSPSNPEPPESKPDDKTPVRLVPFANPSKEYLRRERITQAYLSGQRPDPEDLAEEEADEIRYQQAVVAAREKKLREVLSPTPSPLLESREPPSKNKPARKGRKRDSSKKPPSHPTPSAGDKFWRLTESNFFWGGGVGMILVAYGFLLSGALKFSIALLVIGWAVITISIYRHNFFEGKPRRTQLIGQTLIPAVSAVVLTVLWFSLKPYSPAKENPIIQSQPMPSPIVQTQATPSLIPSPTPTPAPSLSPLSAPSPTAPKSSSKRAKPRVPCAAEDRLLGKC